MTAPSIKLCLALHNHQPIGNFEGVLEAAYQDSYLPFLDLFEPYEHLRLSLHTSGSLAVWLRDCHPEYLSRLADLVSRGRIEMVGGAFYEPILTMIPGRDRRGQIESYSAWLRETLGGPVRGLWIPERVWESELTSDLARTQIEYTVLDDDHFRRAGLNPDQLAGYYITENEGHTLRVFPGSEKLRYLIPFQDPQRTIEFCRQMAEQRPGGVLVFGDDGEKFGTWPDTRKHVYQDGWLRAFFDALTSNRDWLTTTTLADAVDTTPPQGKIYLPDASYREMNEWAMPVQKQVALDQLNQDLSTDERWPRVQPFLSGGYWRNFKVKYPESNEMYARMMYVSRLVEQASASPVPARVLDRARDLLYRGQCNCSYWHGAFGGIYLPHLRNAVYRNLLAAECLVERAQREGQPWVEAVEDDFDFDGFDEVRLANDRLVAWFAPHRGGRMYELDLRDLGHNLLATLERRPESYHQKVRAGQDRQTDEASSIHDRIVFKQEGLEQRLHYDHRQPKSLVDHFWDEGVELDAVAQGRARERGDFADGPFDLVTDTDPGQVRVQLSRLGNAWGVPLKLTKCMTLQNGQSELKIDYCLEGIPPEACFHFGVEFNFAGLPPDQPDRFFSAADGQVLGHLGNPLALQKVTGIGLNDQWLGLQIAFSMDRPGGIWAYPIETVSQSESGFELIHQSTVVQPHWQVRGERGGCWSTTMLLSLTTCTSDNQKHVQRMLSLS
ncbi:MAG: DUF1926 domain-containing protein [Mariniblastus sp.]|nr:DUF1926 domain-containing protein [Mariniblastus sp.]